METKHIMLGVVVIIGIFATINMLNLKQTGEVTYHQLIHKDYMVRRPYYDPCTQVRCVMNAQATQIGETIAGNIVCECPDGEQFIVDQARGY